MQSAQTYTGDSSCGGTTVGRANRFNPFGLIKAGKVGGYNTALNDVGRIAAANRIKPLGSGLVDQSQKMTVAARAMAERKAVGQRS